MVRERVRYTADYLWESPDDGRRYEVIEGELFVTPAPGWFHQLPISGLIALVRPYIRAHNLGWIVPAPTGVKLDDDNGVEPDLVYVAREHERIITPRGVEGAPDLVVEVLSPSTAVTDRNRKMRRYAAAGVPHYWIVDPVHHTLEAYELGANGYGLSGAYGDGDVFRPALFPGLEIPIDELWG